MPAFPIVDTHLHLWDIHRLRYPWLAAVPMLNKNYLIEDYWKACSTVQVAKMIFVQCECDIAQYKEEVEWVGQVAKADPRIRGMVAWAPLEDGDLIEPVIAQFAATGFVKGIRRIIQFESDSEFCLRPHFVRGVQLLARYGLSFDICINHMQLCNTIKLVHQCPEVSFILDHIAKPDIKAGRLDPWRAQVRELASYHNVVCKMSGLVTEADQARWTPANLQPYIDHIIDCFGFERVAFGGDWPVAYQATGYPRWVKVLDQALACASPAELYKLYVGNGERFYRI